MAKQVKKQGEIKVKTPDDLRRGVYANTVNVVATNSEVTLNFIYNNPNDDPSGTLVSRVVVPPSFAKNLSDVLNQVNEDLEDKKEQ